MGPHSLPIGVFRVAPGPAPRISKLGRAGGPGDFKSALADAASRREQTNRTSAPSSADKSRQSERSSKLRDSLTDDRPISSDTSEPDRPIPIENAGNAPDPAIVINSQAANSQLVTQTPEFVDTTPSDDTLSEIERSMSAAGRGGADGEPPSKGAAEEGSSIGGRAAGDDSIRASIDAYSNDRLSSRAAEVVEAEATESISAAQAAEAEGKSASLKTETNRVDRFRTGVDSVNAMPVASGEDDDSDVEPAVMSSAHPRQRVTAPKVDDEEGLNSRVPSGDKRRVLHVDAQERPSDTARGGESVFEEKVRRWIDGRREGSSVQESEAGSVKEAKLESGNSTAMKHAGATNSGSVSPSTTEVRSSLRVLSGRGDGAAASVAKLLLDGVGKIGPEKPASEVATAPGSAGAYPLSSPAGADRGVVASSANGGVGAASGPGTTDVGHRVAEFLNSSDVQSDSVETLSRTLSTSGGSGRYQATLRLDPPELGQVTVRLRMNQQAMTLQVQTENASVSRLVESRLNELRDALSAHGIRVERSEVVTRASETGESRNQGDAQQRSSGDWQRSGGESDAWGGAQDGRGGEFHRSREGEGNRGSAWQAAQSADESAGRDSAMAGGERGVGRLRIQDGSVDLVA